MFANTSKGTKQERDALGIYQCRERAVTLATDVRWEDIMGQDVSIWAKYSSLHIRACLLFTHNVMQSESEFLTPHTQ